jgi:hypothetical protein
MVGYQPAAPVPAEPPDPGPEPEPLWLKLPAELAMYFDLGFCHTDEICPYVVLRVRDDDQPDNPAEVCGPPEAFMDLASMILTLCKSVPCLSAHGAHGEVAHREAV